MTSSASPGPFYLQIPLPQKIPLDSHTIKWDAASHKGPNVHVETMITLREQVLERSTSISVHLGAQLPSKSQRFMLRVVLVLQCENIGQNVLRSH